MPLLRGVGRHIVTESLTQAQREVIYALYALERRKRTLAVQVATDYLRVLQQLDEIKNQTDNHERLMQAAKRAERRGQAGREKKAQVDEAQQDVLRARVRVISARDAYQARLDGLKLTLGLPTDARIALDPRELSALAAPAKAAAAQVELDAVETSDMRGKLEPPVTKAIELGLAKRLDLRAAQGRVVDAQRGVVVAADGLRADLTVTASAAMGCRRGLGSTTNAYPRPDEGVHSVTGSSDLPWERTAERNAYRTAYITLERATRGVQELEDKIKLAIRGALRKLAQTRKTFIIESRAVELALSRVRVTIAGMKDRYFPATLAKIDPLPYHEWIQSIKVFNAEVHFDEVCPDLRPGYTCKVEIVVEHYEDVLSVPVQSVQLVRGKPTVYVRTPTGPQPRVVEVKRGPLTISLRRTGVIHHRNKIIVRSKLEGKSTVIWLIDEGEYVEAGDLLLEMDPTEYKQKKEAQDIAVIRMKAWLVNAEGVLALKKNEAREAIEDAKLDIALAELDLRKYLGADLKDYSKADPTPEDKGEYPQLFHQAQGAITIAKAELERAKERVEWSNKLEQEGYLTRTKLQVDVLAAKKAQLDLNRAQSNLAVLRKYTYTHKVAELQNALLTARRALEPVERKAAADIKQAEANLAANQSEYKRQVALQKKYAEQIERCKVYAPVAGLNRQGKTIVMVTHESNIAAYARSRLHMRDGKIERLESPPATRSTEATR